MNLSYKHVCRGRETTPIKDYIDHEINRASEGEYEQLVGLDYEHQHLTKSFALLVETLAAKGLLTAPEVVKIACHYDADPEATFA